MDLPTYYWEIIMKVVRISLGVVAAMAAVAVYAANRPAGYTTICTESSSSCPSLASATDVAYGRADKFTHKTITGSFTCSEATFGAGTHVAGGVNECSIPS